MKVLMENATSARNHIIHFDVACDTLQNEFKIKFRKVTSMFDKILKEHIQYNLKSKFVFKCICIDISYLDYHIT